MTRRQITVAVDLTVDCANPNVMEPLSMTTDDYPEMPTSEEEWRCHWAFYRLTVQQRDAAWREIEQLRRILTEGSATR